ncbi:hypothetical protein GCM10009846_28950 [Agrococcus versicolor]|uniref:DUF7882 domain-containing protein n=1 Tax=Agrococcus versicolor TaxID=501482 RepID=A0ABN3AYX6_9MICO
MGTFHYGPSREGVDDADLELLRAVVTTMLACSTSFMASFDHGDTRRSFWIHPSAELRFDVERERDVDPWHLDLMLAFAHTDEGLTMRSVAAD